MKTHKLILQILVIAYIALSNPIHALDFDPLIEGGIINKTDSVGRRNGFWVGANSGSHHGSSFMCSYNKQGLANGVWIDFDHNGEFVKIWSIKSYKNGLLQQCIDLNQDESIAFVVDSVRPIDKEMFPAVYEAAEKCKDTEVGKYGMVQFYTRCYNEGDGSLEEEGWNCNFVEADNNFDYIADPLPIGVQKYYEDGKVIEKYETEKTIEILLRCVGLGNDNEDSETTSS